MGADGSIPYSLAVAAQRAGRTAAMVGRALTGRYVVHGGTRDADCVVAFSFGQRRAYDGQVDPGEVNLYLANEVTRLGGQRPVIAQFEIDDALRRQGGREADVRVASGNRAFLDTREVAADAATAMSQNGWRCALVIAQAHHVPRADSTLRAAGVETVTPDGLRSAWDRRSRQPWTRGPVAWALREPAAIMYYLLRGWLA
jgi:uncharacterized SAM-binding protein YcdF (DUF218 family)